MSLAVWIEAARPRTLPASVVPVVVGTATTDRIVADRFGAALIVSMALQVAVNFANDYFDATKGVDTEYRIGPRRATSSGLVSPRAMKVAIVVALMFAAAAGLYLVAEVGPELLVVGAFSILAALGYSGGARPYASAGLGEVFVFVFFGLVATVGTAYTQIERVTMLAVVAAIGVGCIASAIMVVNNLRDIATDQAAGKRTLAVRLGEGRTKQLYRVLTVAGVLGCLLVAVVEEDPTPLVGLLALPLAIRLALAVGSDASGPFLIKLLSRTALLHLLSGALLSAGLWIS